MLYKNTASQKMAVYAYTASTGAAKTGEAAQITGYISKDWGAAAAISDTNPTELDATNMPGWYVFDMTQAETNAEVLIIAAKSSTSGVLIDQYQVFTEASLPQTGDAYARLGAPAGASVSADIADLPTVTEFEARTIAAADYTIVSDLGTVQTGDSYAIVNHADYGNAKLVRSTTPANTLDVSATGEAGLDFANIKDATGAHTLTNITVPTVTTVGTTTNLTNLPAAAALEATLTDMKGAGYTNTTDTLEKIRDAIPAAAPSAADNATAAAAAILVTPANKLTTDASGRVEVSGTKNTLDALNDAADVSADVGSIKGTTDKLDTALELDGAVYRYTANALEEGPAGAAGLTAQDVRDAMKLAPSAGAADADSIDDKLDSISSGSGSGTGSYTDTVTDGVNPLDGVRVQLSTDAAGANRVYETYTDALGVFKLNPDPGVYYVWLDLAGYTFTQGAEVTVT